MKKSTLFVLIALAYIVPTMILGMAWHFLLFEDLYENLDIYNRAEPIIPLGFLSMIIQGIVIAWLYPYYAKEGSTIAKAITFNLMMGLFLYSVSTLANAAKIMVAPMQDWLLVQFAFHFIQFAVAGLLIGLVYKGRYKA